MLHTQPPFFFYFIFIKASMVMNKSAYLLHTLICSLNCKEFGIARFRQLYFTFTIYMDRGTVNGNGQ